MTDPADRRQVFLVEVYAESRRNARDRDAAIARAAASAADGDPAAELLNSIFIPDDETAFYVFRAVDQAQLRAVFERAGVGFDRIVPADAHTLADRALKSD